MGGIKNMMIENETLIEENASLREALEDERESHDACHEYFDMLLDQYKAEIEDLKEALAHEIQDHTNCHEAFNLLEQEWDEQWDEVVGEAEFWKSSFDELAIVSLAVMRELIEVRRELDRVWDGV
jgi:hypothetical protein